MKTILVILFSCCILFSWGQFCGAATNKGTITPSTTSQVTVATGNGQRPYWTFTGSSNCTYTFSTCGLTGMDTELEILQGVGGVPLAFNDDACGTQSSITWACPANGTYTIFMTRWFGSTCRTLNANVSLRYVMSCTGLPIELISFEGYNKNSHNILEWKTASEHNNDFFTIERSVDTENWEIVKTIPGAGSSTQTISYTAFDNNYSNVINYYRLKQTDFDGQYKYSETISINNTENQKIIRRTNLLGQEVNESYRGIILETFEGGKIIKRYQNK